jgi:hypothetical protein
MEIEAHHHHADPSDTFGKIVGIQAAILAMLLSVFTILSSQTNTETIVLTNQTSNQWAHYQAKRIRDSQLELNSKMLDVLAPNNTVAAAMIADFSKQEKKYKEDMDQIKAEADKTDEEAKLDHRKTGNFELAEGLLEISLILSSLYFLSHKKFFPVLGILLGCAGIVSGVIGLLMHP